MGGASGPRQGGHQLDVESHWMGKKNSSICFVRRHVECLRVGSCQVPLLNPSKSMYCCVLTKMAPPTFAVDFLSNENII